MSGKKAEAPGPNMPGVNTPGVNTPGVNTSGVPGVNTPGFNTPGPDQPTFDMPPSPAAATRRGTRDPLESITARARGIASFSSIPGDTSIATGIIVTAESSGIAMYTGADTIERTALSKRR